MTTTMELAASVDSSQRPIQIPATSGKFVVVHSGARDNYQVALALEEAGMLEALVTDLFWPAGRGWAKAVAELFPPSIQKMLQQRSESCIAFSSVRLCSWSGLATLLLSKLRRVPFRMRRALMRSTDARLGRTAGKLASRNHAGLLSYSYYGFDAFSHFTGAGILFQLHPHPLSMRRLLLEELAKHPDCADSLLQEWELALPEEDFSRLVRETAMPAHIIAASSFTRSTLVEHGTAESAVSVIPYGVDSVRFRPAARAAARNPGKLKLLFVGRINQRKGVKYLLQALALLRRPEVELTICGRVVDGLELFKPFASQITIRPSVSNEELIAAYQQADLFIFPSIAEGFGQVLLEAMACGLPVLTTTHTAGPDLFEHGVQGFIVEPGSPQQLAQHVAWALSHPAELADMGRRARLRAEEFTWERFRKGVVEAVAAWERTCVGRCGNV